MKSTKLILPPPAEKVEGNGVDNNQSNNSILLSSIGKKWIGLPCIWLGSAFVLLFLVSFLFNEPYKWSSVLMLFSTILVILLGVLLANICSRRICRSVVYSKRRFCFEIIVSSFLFGLNWIFAAVFMSSVLWTLRGGWLQTKNILLSEFGVVEIVKTVAIATLISGIVILPIALFLRYKCRRAIGL